MTNLTGKKLFQHDQHLKFHKIFFSIDIFDILFSEMCWLCLLHLSLCTIPFFLFSDPCLNHLRKFDNKFLDIEELYIIDHIELLEFYPEIILDCFLNFTQLLQLKCIPLEIL